MLSIIFFPTPHLKCQGLKGRTHYVRHQGKKITGRFALIFLLNLKLIGSKLAQKLNLFEELCHIWQLVKNNHRKNRTFSTRL